MDKLPFTIDQRGFRTAVDTLMSLERARKIQAAAMQLGGYSVDIVAAAGDPYKVVYDEAGIETTTAAMIVPDDKVIMSMRNTANPNAPTDISGLNCAANEQT